MIQFYFIKFIDNLNKIELDAENAPDEQNSIHKLLLYGLIGKP
jgi:hypothetical protein